VRTQIQFQVQSPVWVPEPAVVGMPGVEPDVEPVVAFCQIQFQIDPSCDAAVGSVPSVGGVQVPFQTQFHSHDPSGTTGAGSGRTSETSTLVPAVVVTMLVAGLEPVAVAPLTCVRAPSTPGLPTRIETFAFNAPVWLEVAVPVVGAFGGAVAAGVASGPFGVSESTFCSMSCWSVPSLVTPADPPVATV
jgi:hypothetical protein